MSALAPLYQETPPIVRDAEPPLAAEVVDPVAIAAQIAEQNELLGAGPGIPEAVRLFVEDLGDQLAAAPAPLTLRADPYLLVSLQQSLIGALRAIEREDPELARGDLRVRLEQLRQVYRDLADLRPSFDDLPAAELIAWLDRALDLPQAQLGELLGVSPRTLQRWLGGSEPTDEDAHRIRLLATLVAHLRHSLTGRGILAWFERPHPMLEERAPLQLFEEPDALPRLARLAASTRSSITA